MSAPGRAVAALRAPLELPFGSPWLRARAALVLWAAAFAGIVIGAWGTWIHLTTDPLADVRAYYDAGARLNAGLPLYPADADTDRAEFYRYPPLLAIAFRPLALLPYEVAAAIWGAAMVATAIALVRRLGAGRPARIALALLALPLGWSVVIGQAQVLVTLLVLVGTPAAIALAANLKLMPALVGLYWLGRRDVRSVARLAAWGVGLLGLQFVLDPASTVAFLGFSNLEQVGNVYNLSLYAISPLLWVAFLAAGGLATLWLAPTRWGWAAAVAFSVLATPRLLVYQLMGLLPATARPDAARPR